MFLNINCGGVVSKMLQMSYYLLVTPGKFRKQPQKNINFGGVVSKVLQMSCYLFVTPAKFKKQLRKTNVYKHVIPYAVWFSYENKDSSDC